jgi:hypothetical protein
VVPLVVGGLRLAPAHMQCMGVRIDAVTNTLGDLLTLPPLKLTVEKCDTQDAPAMNQPMPELRRRARSDRAGQCA